MSFELSYRPTQTKIKHHILDQYLKAWGGIIVNGSRNQARLAREKGNDFAVHFVYVDCNAYAGRYFGEQEEIASGETPTTVFGSPIVGVQALDSLISYGNEQNVPVKVNAILIEENRETFEELKATLKIAELDDRVRETQDFGGLQNKEIAILNRDSLDLVEDLVQYTQEGFKFSLYFLDPYGPKGIPIGFVSDIVGQERHDTIINMPYQALHRRTGSVMKQNPTEEERKLVEHFDEMFGNREWQKVAKELEEEITWKEMLEEATGIEGDLDRTELSRELEVKLMDLYKESMLTADPTLAVKPIGLKFPAANRTMFYLYLTTHDPTGALAMNEKLAQAGYFEDELRWRLRDIKKRPSGQMHMFDALEADPELPKRPRPAVEEIADRLVKDLKGRIVVRREIYRQYVDEPYFASEINQALSQLKRQDRVEYDSPANNNSPIKFK